ncbi:hypothetical protein UFOVP276_8 [uncultured Caudovirales phage]|uniref:Uncharacterized protein n=1 Tax=uncultured Caudovirales phage TaxID=2100421 RepID=A0A6J5LDU6_9CAUD|nr:hypothetical protein UFOVP127_145 [uncultured Caudovirales phage]CAB4134761.1 hypothetical protein UFOVP276_8 [uncultured Caudovirales phage]
MDPVMHLMTQRNQPYGSTRRCCEMCGVMIWPHPQPLFTTDPEEYENPPQGFIRCIDLKEKEQHGKEI